MKYLTRIRTWVVAQAKAHPLEVILCLAGLVVVLSTLLIANTGQQLNQYSCTRIAP